MNFIDIIIIILVLLAAFKGFGNGLIKELVSLLSLIIGVYIASNFSVYFEKYLIKHFSKIEEFITILSFVLVFLIVFFSLKLAGILISKLAKSLQIGLINKFLGILFGSSKAILIIALILFELNHLEQRFSTIIPKNQKEESKLYPLFVQIIPTIIPIAKEKFNWKDKKNKIKNKINEIKKELDSIPE